MDEALSVVALLVVLLALLRGERTTGLLAAVVAVVVLLATGAVTPGSVHHVLDQLGPTVGFLAAVLVLADAAAGDGLFRAAGSRLALTGRHSAGRMYGSVVGLAAVTTAVLSLDTTVVLLTPTVRAGVREAGRRERLPLYATAHLANSASTLLPVSNLTNLIAVSALPVSYPRFAGLMVLPWLLAVAVETAVLGRLLRADLQPAVEVESTVTASVPLPRLAAAVVGLTLVGFAASSVVPPVLVATAGAVVLAGRRLLRRETDPRAVLAAASPALCLTVLALGVVVQGAAAHGLASDLRHVVPSGSGFTALLGVAAVGAVAANLVNNLPAVLLLLPLVVPNGLGPVLALLVGVNTGPNLTYVGSLAVVLWRRVVADVPRVPTLGEWTRLGLATVPATVVGGVAALWLALRVVGT